jgi:hypothetical protein
MCYCDSPEDQILLDIGRGSVPEDALVRACCWREICRTRGRNFDRVDADVWRQVCAKRGFLYARQNPRGF